MQYKLPEEIKVYIQIPVPSLRAELASLGYYGVEITQREQYRFEFGLFAAHLKRFLIKVVQRLIKVTKNIMYLILSFNKFYFY